MLKQDRPILQTSNTNNDMVDECMMHQYENYLQTSTGMDIHKTVFMETSSGWPPAKAPTPRKRLTWYDRQAPRLNISNYQVIQLSHGHIMIHERLERRAQINNKGGSSFHVVQYCGPKFSIIAMCPVVDHLNGSYSIKCPGYKLECISISIDLQFERFDAFRDVTEKRVRKSSLLLWRNVVCPKKYFANTTIPISWILNYKGECQTLNLDGETVHLPSTSETCQCIERFDDIYIIGVSHIRFVADYLMIKCCGFNMASIPKGHRDLSYKNVHYLFWMYMKDLQAKIRAVLPQWLNRPSNSSIAIWIQYGDWDIANTGLGFTYGKHLDMYRKGLEYILTVASKSTINVDLRILGFACVPDARLWNNYALGASNARLRHILNELKVSFTDVYGLELPCRNDVAKIRGNTNHYFQRTSNSNDLHGRVGERVYFGVFLSGVCARINHRVSTVTA